MFPFIFVTQSLDKVTEVERTLGRKISNVEINLPELQAIELEKVIQFKAEFAYNHTSGQPVMVEDTGLFIEAWNGLPGALIKWFVKSVGLTGICRMLDNFPSRRAYARTVIMLYDGQTLKSFVGEIAGHISNEPYGDYGFGWDPIFIPEGSDETFAQMSADKKDEYSMRRRAVEAMLKYQSNE